MSHVKLLISGLPNSGKTTLLQSLEDVLVIAHDGKAYPFPQPHVNVPDFSSVDELIALIDEKIGTYVEKLGHPPKTIVIDSISKILLTIEGNILSTVKSFPYGVINTEIKQFMDYLENTIVANANLVLVSHALFDKETAVYSLVNAGGSWGKKGGVISEVDNAVTVEIKGSKRIVHHKSPKMLARTVLEDAPETQPMEEYNLQDHINALAALSDKVADFAL
jgi:hypothetical protein